MNHFTIVLVLILAAICFLVLAARRHYRSGQCRNCGALLPEPEKKLCFDCQRGAIRQGLPGDAEAKLDELDRREAEWKRRQG